MRHFYSYDHSPNLLRRRIDLLDPARAPQTGSTQNASPAVNTPAYHFLAHPDKKSLFAAEKLLEEAPDIQLPLVLHPHDADALFNRLLLAEKTAGTAQITMQARIQAIDGCSWILCTLNGFSLPSSYKSLYGWHIQAYQKTAEPEDAAPPIGGDQVLYILSQLYNAGLWQYSLEEERLEVDYALQKLLNLEKRKLSFHEWLRYIHPEDAKRLLKKVFNIQRKGGLFQLHIRYKSPSSLNYRYLGISASAHYNPDQSLSITGLCFDDTRQQRQQSKNTLNKAFLDQAQSLGQIGCFEWLPELNRLSATAHLKNLSGLSKEEDFSLEYLQDVLPADDLIALEDAYQRFLSGNHTQELTIRFRDAAGSMRTLWIRAQAHYTKSRMVSLIGIVQDVSDRVDKKLQLQAKDKLIGGFLKNLPVCILTINKKLQIISVIGTGLSQTGLDRKKVIGQSLHTTLPEFIAPLKSVFEGVPTNFTVERNRTDGNPGLQLFNYYYYDADRELAIGFSLDISHQKQAELAAQHLNQLEHRYQLMDTFVHAVAHDLRSPVVNLDMLLAFFTKEITPEEQSKYLAAMTNGIQHLKRTLDALIEILRIEKDSAELAENISFKQLISELEQEYGDKLIQAEGSLHTYFQCETIYYNKAYLSSILRNLISNAIKYSYPDRPPHITLCTEQKGDVVMLLVQDNGMGMDLKKWGHLLFQPFKRLNNHRKGTGIGLHLVKQIIEKNGGKIKVKSQPGQGTTFFCFLRPYL